MKHFIFPIILFTALLMVNAQNAYQFPQCSGNYPNPVNLSMTPFPPVFGDDVEVFFSTFAYTTVEAGAYVDIQISNPSWVYPVAFQQDICNNDFAITCPVSNQFNYNYTYSFIRNNETLPVNIQARLVNPDNTVLSCIEGNVTVQPTPQQK